MLSKISTNFVTLLTTPPLKILVVKLLFVDILQNKLHVNATTNLQSLLYIFLVLSGCVKQSRKLPCGNSLFRVHTLTHYLHYTMYIWDRYEKDTSACIHCIRSKSIQDPGRPPLLTLHQPSTLEASTCMTKNSCSSKNCTQFNPLPSDLIHNIGMWHAGLVQPNKLKPSLMKITQHNPVLRASKSYKLKFPPFE